MKKVGSRHYAAKFLDPDNAGEMEAWARGICGGATIAQMAEFFGVSPTESAVLQRVERGLPERAASVVRKTCADAMRRAEAGEQA